MIYENLESDQNDQDSMIPVFTSKDYGMIAAINQTTSGDSQWLVVLGFLEIYILLESWNSGRNGLLSLTKFIRADEGKTVEEDTMVSYDILRNAITMELIDNYVMIQLPDGIFQLYSLIEDRKGMFKISLNPSWSVQLVYKKAESKWYLNCPW